MPISAVVVLVPSNAVRLEVRATRPPSQQRGRRWQMKHALFQRVLLICMLTRHSILSCSTQALSCHIGSARKPHLASAARFCSLGGLCAPAFPGTLAEIGLTPRGHPARWQPQFCSHTLFQLFRAYTRFISARWMHSYLPVFPPIASFLPG